jgi:hypothetical protein
MHSLYMILLVDLLFLLPHLFRGSCSILLRVREEEVNSTWYRLMVTAIVQPLQPLGMPPGFTFRELLYRYLPHKKYEVNG